jgi:hypothetical protein
MPHVVNQGVRIHYEMEGSGPPLVLQHGTLGSGADWNDFGYVDALKDNYQLILLMHEDTVPAINLMNPLHTTLRCVPVMSRPSWMTWIFIRRIILDIRWADGSDSVWRSMHRVVSNRWCWAGHILTLRTCKRSVTSCKRTARISFDDGINVGFIND